MTNKSAADVAREIAEGNMVEDEKGIMVVDNWANLIDDIAIAIERERASRLPSIDQTIEAIWDCQSKHGIRWGVYFYDWLASQMAVPKAEEARTPLRVPPNKTIEFLQAQVKELTEIAEAWMNDYDKLKAKYEPTELVTSANTERPEVKE